MKFVGKKMLISLLFVFIFAIYGGIQAPQADAAEAEIQVYFEGSLLVFDDSQPLLMDGRTMVPFRKIFEALGYEVAWVGASQTVSGTSDGTSIALTINSKQANVNGQTVELDVPAQILQERTLVPLRFVSENSGFEVNYTNNAGVHLIRIGQPGEEMPEQPEQPTDTPPASMESVEPYVIKGQVTTMSGNPVADVRISAYNSYLRSSYVGAVSDEQGYYRIELPEITTTYWMYAVGETQYQGEQFTVKTIVDNDDVIPAHDGAIRNFTWDINVGSLNFISLENDNLFDLNAPALVYPYDDVEITMEPVGPLLDGSAGTTIVDIVPNLVKGGIPVGVYKISAVWKPQGLPTVQLLVSPTALDDDMFAESVTIGLEEVYYTEFTLAVKFPQ